MFLISEMSVFCKIYFSSGNIIVDLLSNYSDYLPEIGTQLTPAIRCNFKT